MPRKASRGMGKEKLARMPREGRVLRSPFSKLQSVKLSSWRDERLPEMLWASILTASLDRAEYLQVFREIADRCKLLESYAWEGLGHTNLAKLSDDDFDTLLEPIKIRNLFGHLHALSLFADLPDSAHWQRCIPNWDQTEAADYDVVAIAIGLTSWHQSVEATDIRWLRVISMIIGDRMRFTEATKSQAEEILGFPNVGDMRKVRPSIRAAEQSFGSFSMVSGEPLSLDWVGKFWKQCRHETQCLRAEPERLTRVNLAGLFENIISAYREVERHFHSQESFEAVDAKLDAVFGITLYSLNLLINLITGNSYRRVEGRHILRSLCECYITLAYLIRVDSEKTWMQYRNFGHGQAKLSYLKSIDLSDKDKAKFFREDDLEEFANEDKWQEFVDIDLGSWSKLNLRKMSEEAGVKGVYDKYYSWSSGYVHGQWSAVRDTVFDLCMNPLHRLHRIPAIPRANMPDCAEDATKLVNLTLGLLNQAYPSFKPRLKFPRQG